MLTYNSICSESLEDVVQDLVAEFCVDIPTNVESYDEMAKAGNLLGELTNSYSYMVALLMMLKAGTRSLKRNKEKKDEYEDMVGKRDAVSDTADMIKQQYNAISRMITVKKEMNDELKMTGGK